MQESHWTETFLFPTQMVPTCRFSATLYCLKSAKVLLHLVKCLQFFKEASVQEPYVSYRLCFQVSALYLPRIDTERDL